MTVNQQRVQYTQMENGSQEIDAMTGEFNPQMVFDETRPFTTVTVQGWYDVLLDTLNSIFFTIDEQFNEIRRTVPLEDDIVKEIAYSDCFKS